MSQEGKQYSTQCKTIFLCFILYPPIQLYIEDFAHVPTIRISFLMLTDIRDECGVLVILLYSLGILTMHMQWNWMYVNEYGLYERFVLDTLNFFWLNAISYFIHIFAVFFLLYRRIIDRFPFFYSIALSNVWNHR